MIEVKGLTKTYGEHKAIDALDFEVKKGEVVGFLGPNGAGKSTTMKIITGFMAASHGQVKVDGFDVFENPIAVKSRIGYLPETPPVYLDMRVGDYLQFVSELKKIDSSKKKSEIDAAIEKTQLSDVQGRLIGNLSKGYRQRVGLAQALLGTPPVLILDEPTVGLDPRQVSEMRELLKKLKGSHTIILSTHIMPEVEASCEKVIIINKGKIIAKDSIDFLKSQIKGSRIVRLRVRRKQDELSQKLKAFDGVQSVEMQNDSLQVVTNGTDDLVEKLSEIVVSSGAGLIELTQPTAGLEAVFMQLTGDSLTNGEDHV